MKKIELFYQNKNKIHELNIKGLEGYAVEKLLYCDLWNMAGLSRIDKIKRVAAHLICNSLELVLQDEHCSTSRNAVFEIQIKEQKREDNKIIFQNLYNYMKPAQHYKLKKKYKINLSGAWSRLVKTIRYGKHLINFTWDEKLFLGAQLVMVDKLIELLDRYPDIAHSKNMLIFQEHDTLSSTVIQYVHNKGGKVISPQHGMPLNRHEDLDQLFFEGFQCDYKLLWNEFEKKQFVSAGIPKERLFVIGNTKKLGKEGEPFVWHKTGIFGIVLNCPENDGAIEYNKKLLNIANLFACSMEMKGLVRLHPIDSIESYEDVLDHQLLDIMEQSKSMDIFEQSIEFAIGHLTGAIADLIYDGCFVFVFKYGQYYPIETSPVYEFDSYEKLKENYNKWKKNFEFYSDKYQNIIDLYRVKNSLKLHKEFFEGINNTNE